MLQPIHRALEHLLRLMIRTVQTSNGKLLDACRASDLRLGVGDVKAFHTAGGRRAALTEPLSDGSSSFAPATAALPTNDS